MLEIIKHSALINHVLNLTLDTVKLNSSSPIC